MKRPFPLILAIVIVTTALAQKPLSKKSLHQHSSESIVLKSYLEDYLPTHCTTDYWIGNEWIEPIIANLKYNEDGLLWISESSTERITYTYYDNHKLKDKVKELFNGNSWLKDYKYSYIYDDNGLLSQVLIYYWISSDWELSEGTWNERIYDVFGQEVGVISYYYDYPDGWVEIYGYKTDYNYEDGLLTEQISYDRYEGSWFASWKNIWVYDDDNLICGGYEYYHNGSNFDLVGRYIDVNWYFWNPEGHVQSSYVKSYTYQEYTGPEFPHEEMDNEAYFVEAEKLNATYPDGDGGGTPPTTIETYQIYNGNWTNDFRWTWLQMSDYNSEFDEIWSQSSWLKYYYTIDFKTDELVYSMTESYRNGVLSKASKDSEIYDEFGNQTEVKNETRSGDEDWIQQTGEKWIYTYEEATSKVLTKVYQNWDVELSGYMNSKREQFNYEATSVNNLLLSEIKVFPTVFNQYFEVHSMLCGSLSIYNLSGTLVHEQRLNVGINSIRTAEFKNGLYLIKINTDEGNLIQKLIKQ